MAIYNNENLPDSITFLPKQDKNLPNTTLTLKMAEDFWHFAKVAKFRQIWSHSFIAMQSYSKPADTLDEKIGR